MLEEASRGPRRPQPSSDLHRWTMLRMAINEDKCLTLATLTKNKKKGKEGKQPNSVRPTLFVDLPSFTAMKAWKSKANGDIRKRYGGRSEWDSGLTDSAYLMYGIPRATLKRDHLVKLKERHLRKKVTPSSLNHSKSFSHYSTPSALAGESLGERRGSASHSLESSVSSLSDSPPSPTQPQRPPKHLPPNSVSVLPRENPNLLSLNHVGPITNSHRTANSSAQPGASPPAHNNNNGSAPFRTTETRGQTEYTNHQKSPSPKLLTGSHENQNNNCNIVRKTARVEPEVNGNFSSQTLPKPQQRDFEVNNAFETNNNGSKQVSTIPEPPPPPPLPKANGAPPAPKMPIYKRPPHPAPKPKPHEVRAKKFNMDPLQEALMGSLNKRLKRQFIKVSMASS